MNKREKIITHFNIEVVKDFLIDVVDKPIASGHWKSYCDCQDNDGTIEYIQTGEWFKRYFPSNENQFLFRLLEEHTIDHRLPYDGKM